MVGTPGADESSARGMAAFLGYPVALKSVQRSGWVSKVKVKNAESVADHSYSMCVAGMVLADLQGLDAEAAMRMILLHDLPEAITGDRIPGEIDSHQKVSEETEAMTKILSHLPKTLRAKYADIWKEYAEGRTELARFVHRIDKLEMGLQAREYARQGHSGESLQEFHASALRGVEDGETANDVAVAILTALSREEERK